MIKKKDTKYKKNEKKISEEKRGKWKKKEYGIEKKVCDEEKVKR